MAADRIEQPLHHPEVRRAIMDQADAMRSEAVPPLELAWAGRRTLAIEEEPGSLRRRHSEFARHAPLAIEAYKDTAALCGMSATCAAARLACVRVLCTTDLSA